uniref:DNA polymerase delta subunit 3 n=1 Tax=Aureoumbra lagunensis TaxID=44058 RepID=A0A7S3K6Q2_9STRA
MSNFEEVCISRFACEEAVSVSLLARSINPENEKYNDTESARESLEAFGRKRKANQDTELIHVVRCRKRVKSGFSDLEVNKEIVLLIAENEAQNFVDEGSCESQLYCVAPNATSAKMLGYIDAEKTKSLFIDPSEIGEAFRRNRGARIRLPDEALKIKSLQDWNPQVSTMATTKTKPPAKPPATMREQQSANTFTSFFCGGGQKKSAQTKTSQKSKSNTSKNKPNPLPPTAKPQDSKPRRRVLDDDDDDDENENAPPATNNKKEIQQSCDDDDKEPAKVAPPKSNAPRLVEKTFMDEKGYLVTEKIWENPPPEPQPRPQLIVHQNKKATNLPKPKPKKAKPQPKGQTGIASFFKSK